MIPWCRVIPTLTDGEEAKNKSEEKRGWVRIEASIYQIILLLGSVRIVFHLAATDDMEVSCKKVSQQHNLSIILLLIINTFHNYIFNKVNPITTQLI